MKYAKELKNLHMVPWLKLFYNQIRNNATATSGPGQHTIMGENMNSAVEISVLVTGTSIFGLHNNNPMQIRKFTSN